MLHSSPVAQRLRWDPPVFHECCMRLFARAIFALVRHKSKILCLSGGRLPGRIRSHAAIMSSPRADRQKQRSLAAQDRSERHKCLLSSTPSPQVGQHKGPQASAFISLRVLGRPLDDGAWLAMLLSVRMGRQRSGGHQCRCMVFACWCFVAGGLGQIAVGRNNR